MIDEAPGMNLSATTLRDEFTSATSADEFGLSISLTEQCNFRCTYCYETFEQHGMSVDNYQKLRQLAQARIPGLRRFELSWFGGEPLLEWKRMADFTRLCTTLCRENSVDMLPSSVPTNAYGLTPEIMSELVGAGVGVFMISLDGLEGMHDRTRKTLAGKGTFDRIYGNLRKLAQTDLPFKIIIRMHLHRENVSSQLALAGRLRADFGDDHRFTYDPVGLGDFGGPTIHLLSLLEKADARIAKGAIEAVLPIREPLINHSAFVCYAAKPNRFYIRPDGNVYKCTSAGGREDNKVGSLGHGGAMVLDQEKIWAWSFGFETGVEEHLSCPLQHKSHVYPIRFVYRDRRVAR
jgi:uncharacterized protein